MGFTPSKAEQPLQGMESQEKKHKKINAYRKSVQKEPTVKRCLIYKTNTYRKELSWLHFDDEPRVQEKQQVKGQQSCISVFVAYPTIPSSNQEHQPRCDNNIPFMAV